jgi:hypothetical protein
METSGRAMKLSGPDKQFMPGPPRITDPPLTGKPLKTADKTKEYQSLNRSPWRTGRNLLLGTTAGLVTLGLSGCFINRAAEVQDQFCDFDSNFSLQFAESANFNFHNPVLLDKDILWIAGASPTHIEKNADDLSMLFVLEKAGPNPVAEDDIQVELKFDQIDEKYKLMNVRFDPKLNTLINPEMLDEATIDTATRNMCELGWSFASTKIVMDISDHNLDELPSRTEFLEWLGPPLESDEESGSFTYEYLLKGEESDRMTARFTVWFDDSGDKPVRMDSEYSHFLTSTDFVKKKMMMKVKI